MLENFLLQTLSNFLASTSSLICKKEAINCVFPSVLPVEKESKTSEKTHIIVVCFPLKSNNCLQPFCLVVLTKQQFYIPYKLPWVQQQKKPTSAASKFSTLELSLLECKIQSHQQCSAKLWFPTKLVLYSGVLTDPPVCSFLVTSFITTNTLQARLLRTKPKTTFN